MNIIEEMRRELVTGHYEYVLSQRHDAYYVTCKDTNGIRRLEHGPMSLNAANTMIDSRVHRDKSAQR